VGNEENFAESWLSSKHKVFGLSLRPFSNWHRFLLMTMESPLMNEGSSFAIGDVYKFCTTTFPNTPPISWRDTIRLYVWRKLEKDLTQLSDKIKNYLDDHNAVPTFTIEEEEGKASFGSDTTNDPPEPIVQIMTLMSLGYKESEAWDMSVGKSSWLLTVHAKMQGVKVLFDSNKEDQIIAMLRAKRDSGEAAEELRKAQERIMKDIESGAMPKHIMNRKTV